MLTRTQLTLIIALSLAVVILWLGAQGKSLTFGSVATTLGIAVGVVYGAVLLFAGYVWPWPVFRGWLVKRPDLRGTWKATLYSDWIDPKSQQKTPPIEAYVVVRQTLTTLSMRLFTDKSRSVSIAYAIDPEPDGLFNLSAVYRNSPKIELQGNESAIHHGALLIEVHEVKPTHLEGHYWTDRNTRGTIELQYKTSFEFSSFELAKQAPSRARG